MIRRLALLVAVAACGDTTNTSVSQLNLDRPVDIAFACYGGLRITNGNPANIDQPIELTPQPTAACDFRSVRMEQGGPVPLPDGQEDLTSMGGANVPGVSWYGFILQQAPGTVAIAEWSTVPDTYFNSELVEVKDADQLTPGKNAISVGEDPVGIVMDTSGCYAITANAGSCDLSVLDAGSAIRSALGQDTGITVSRLDVRDSANNPIRSRPSAIVVQPQGTGIGFSCPAEPQGLVYIAYPSCHLVAGVDLTTGTMVTGIQYDAAGVPSLVTGPVTCPDESGGGAMTTPGPRPVALDLELEPESRFGGPTRRMVIGVENLPSLALVELDVDSRPIAQPTQIDLEDTTGNLGVTAVAMSTEIGMGGSSGQLDDINSPGGLFQFVYAIATDDTVRVVDILDIRSECDTQVDPRHLRDERSIHTLACMPVGDTATPPRRAGARGPGIELTGFTTDPVPMSVEIISSTQPTLGGEHSPLTPGGLVGYFGIITATTGDVFVVNIDDDNDAVGTGNGDIFNPDDPLARPVPLTLPHSLRDALEERAALGEESVVNPDMTTTTFPACETGGPVSSNGDFLGGPRAVTPPARVLAGGAIPAEKSIQLPGLRQLTCKGKNGDRVITELAFAADPKVRDRTFPDLRAVRRDETWTLTWEGSLSNDNADNDVDGPQIRESQLLVDPSGMHLRDQTRPFCDAGVEPYDIVQMRGCDPSLGDLECPINYRCYVHPASQVTGLGACILDEEADRLADACKDFLTSIRRYTVARAESGELLLMPRRHELRTTPLDGCVDDAQCEFLADYAARQATARHPVDDMETTDARSWVCRVDNERKPRGSGPTANRRCNLACDKTADCAFGTVCAGDNDTPEADDDVKEGLCMEGITPPQACVNAPQRYEVRAGEAFAVVGTRSGYVHPIIADNPSGRCIRDPGANRLVTSRIPLVAPACDPTADPVTGILPGGGFEPNPCSTTVANSDVMPNYIDASCTIGSDPVSTIVERPAVPAIQLRTQAMNLTLVEPTYPGDTTCIADRQGYMGTPLVRIPLPFTGYQLSFRVAGGFTPLQIPISPTFPVKVVRGPTQSIWVIDEGDFLSTSIGTASTRGTVFRIEHHALNLVKTLQ